MALEAAVIRKGLGRDLNPAAKARWECVTGKGREREPLTFMAGRKRSLLLVVKGFCASPINLRISWEVKWQGRELPAG